MQFALRIALLAHDALLSRRRDVPVDLSGEAALQTSAHPGRAATAPDNPIRRKRIELNSKIE